MIMEFVLGFQNTQQDNDSIFLVVYRFSKMTHFISYKETSDESRAEECFFPVFVRLHGVPKTITYDRGTRVFGHFLRTLWKKIGTKLHFSNAYPPQTDGKT